MATMFEIFNVHILITCILLCVISIVGLVGNCLMIRAWLKYRKLRTDFYTVFTFLGLADMIFLLVNTPAQIIELVDFEATIMREGWCKASNYLTNACGFIAAYLIVVLSVLRGILLTNRNSVSRPQAKHMLIVCIVFYVMAFLLSIPILNMYFEYDGFCEFVKQTDPKREIWLISSFASVVPLFMVIVIYLFTYFLGKRFFADSYSPREREKSRLVTSMIIAFVICQIPYRVAAIYDEYLVPEDTDDIQKMFTLKGYLMCLLTVDKAIRPVLYSKMALDLSNAFDEVINCSICSKTYTVPPTLVSRRDQHFTPTMVSSTCNNMSGACAVALSSDVYFGGPPVDRSISTSSSASATSQTPLTKRRGEGEEEDDDDIEMV